MGNTHFWFISDDAHLPVAIVSAKTMAGVDLCWSGSWKERVARDGMTVAVAVAVGEALVSAAKAVGHDPGHRTIEGQSLGAWWCDELEGWR